MKVANIIKGMALINVFAVGCLGLGLVSLLQAGAWNPVFIGWIVFWVVVGVLAELAYPSTDYH